MRLVVRKDFAEEFYRQRKSKVKCLSIKAY